MTQQELDEKVIKAYATEECQKPILDGVVNEEIFRSGIPKILWLMKEPYGEQDWNMRTELNESSQGMFGYRTFKNVTYVSYGIINSTSFEQAKEAENNFEILKSVAFVNISKCPVEQKMDSQNYGRLQDTFNRCKDVLLNQIDYIDPDIIIGGNIAYMLIEHYGLDWKKHEYLLSKLGRGCYSYENKLIINAYHPSAIAISQSNYCTEMIDVGKDWIQKIKNK